MTAGLKTCGSTRLASKLPPACATLALLATLVAPAAAQTNNTDIRFVNPEPLGPSRGYSYVVDVNHPGRILYLAGQLGTDPSGKVVSADFRAQATQAYENIKVALASVGAKFENVVKINVYLTDIRAQLATHREVRDKYVNTANPPASTTIEISRLAREGGLIEVEVVAVLPAR
jgi:enamine deaminase RidA (YjgF/YER057c/UK114 family)